MCIAANNNFDQFLFRSISEHIFFFKVGAVSPSFFHTKQSYPNFFAA